MPPVTAETAPRSGEGPERNRIRIPAAVLTERAEDDVHVLLWQVHGSTDTVLQENQEERPPTTPEKFGELTAGSALWIPAGVRHSFTVREDSVAVPLFFSRHRIATTLRQPTLVSVGQDLHSLLLAHMVSCSSQIRPAGDIARQVLALIEKSPIASEALPVPESPAAHRIAEFLRFNPGDARSISELAASVHTSERTVERVFLAETGMTLRTWRIRSRMEAAAVLLRSETTVEAVAHRVGYTHVNAFRRVFRRHFGISPTRYAAQRRSA